MKIHTPIKSDNLPQTRSKSSQETLEVLAAIKKLKSGQSLPVEMDSIQSAKSLYSRLRWQFNRLEMSVTMSRRDNMVYFTKE